MPGTDHEAEMEKHDLIRKERTASQYGTLQHKRKERGGQSLAIQQVWINYFLSGIFPPRDGGLERPADDLEDSASAITLKSKPRDLIHLLIDYEFMEVWKVNHKEARPMLWSRTAGTVDMMQWQWDQEAGLAWLRQ